MWLQPLFSSMITFCLSLVTVSALAQDPSSIHVDSSDEAQTVSAEFLRGVQAYHAEQWREAESIFSQLVKDYPQAVPVLYNLALSQLKNDKPAAAYAHLQRSLYVDPFFSPAWRAIKVAKEELNILETSILATWPETTKFIVVAAPWTLFVAFFCVLFVVLLWLLIPYLHQRRLRRSQELPSPSWPWPATAALLLLGVELSLASAKIIYQSSSEGVIVKSVAARTSPTSEGLSIFHLRQGDSVAIQREHKGWIQIEDPTNQSGWVPAQSIIYSLRAN